ncbi:MAG: protein kinase [Candidatus Aminicenantes bacterium]|nr:protein kinase [Candidatus Aminicenantes bacterium]
MIKIGDKTGHFLIKAEIGRGGMGTIYFAIDTMLNREVALKAIHPQLADNQQLMDRFKIEAMTQARMNHPNIVTIFSFNKIDDQYIIAMEYVEGKSLKELLQAKKRLELSEAISIVIQVAEGLAYAHAHNVIHRDIKPANILLDKENKVKISDFGIAKVFGAEGLTKTGMMMGTPWYTPPEQIMGKNIDFRADLYSLGVTFYELLTSRVPFDSETNSEFQIQKAHLETPPPRPSIYNPQIGVKLENIILQALQKKVEKRFQSAGEMITALKKIHHESIKLGRSVFTQAGQTQSLDVPAVKHRFSLPAFLAVAFLVIVLAGGIYWITMSPKSALNDRPGGAEPKALPPVAVVQERATENPEKLPAQENIEPARAEETPLQEIVAAGQNADAEKKIPASPDTVDVKTPLIDTPVSASEDKKELPDKVEPQATEKIIQEQPLQPEPLGSLDAELIRLRSLLAKGNLSDADRLADALLQSSNESRIFPILGNVKFFLNQFAAAEKMWQKSLQANHLITLELKHMHEGSSDFCPGQLKFNNKTIMFSSNTRGDHSFALQTGTVKSISMGENLGIIIRANINGMELKETFMLFSKFKLLAKEKFLVDFLNKYVLPGGQVEKK